MISFIQFLSESANMGINVRSDNKAGISYADHIVDGKKTMESRETNSLHPYIGKRVAIVKTGEGEAHAIGEVTVGNPIVVDEEGFRKHQDHHLVPQGSQFDIKQGKTKHLYPMINPIRYNTPKKVGKGIIARKVQNDNF